jgi:hypothetical protein
VLPEIGGIRRLEVVSAIGLDLCFHLGAFGRDEALSLVPGEPGSLGGVRGALARKPPAPPPAPTVPMPAKTRVGVFYDRRGTI